MFSTLTRMEKKAAKELEAVRCHTWTDAATQEMARIAKINQHQQLEHGLPAEVRHGRITFK